MPQNLLSDEKIQAAAQALDVELQRLSADSKLVMHLPRLDELDHDVLNHLAYHFHVDHFEPETMSLTVKRNLIRQSILWHKIKGTPASVENFLGYFGITAKVQEWYDYEGEPYYFRLKLSNVAWLGDDGDTFLRLINASKNERSWLDKFIFDLERVDNEVYVAMPEITAHIETVSDSEVGSEKIELAANPAVVDATIEQIFDVNISDLSPPICAGIFIGESGHEHIFPAPLPDEELERFYEWVWLIYKRWLENAVWDFYKIDDSDDDEILSEGNYLRLFFEFPKRRIKTITLSDPKEEVTAQEINSAGDYVISNEVLTDTYGSPALKLAKALLIIRKYEKFKFY